MCDLASNIRAERARYRITQRELASRIGWYRQALSAIEQGHLTMTPDQYAAIMAAIEAIARERAGQKEER